MRPESSTCRVRTFVQAASHSPMLDAPVAASRAGARVEISESRPRAMKATLRSPCDVLPGSRRSNERWPRGLQQRHKRHVKHCTAIMVRSVKDILTRSGRTAGCVKHIHVTYGRPVVGAGKEMQKATLWQAPNNSIMVRLSTGP